MGSFILNSKSGFLTNDKKVIITDSNGNPFYIKDNDGLLHFNLPSGKYNTNNDLLITVLRQYKYKDEPKGNNIKNLPNGFKMYFTHNPHKCTVNNETHEIFFDNQFKDAPLFVLDYIKLHELGHYFYSGKGGKSEKLADNFSYNQMLEHGYNPSQIQTAIEYSLGNSNLAKNRKLNFLIMNKKQYK